jgi:hypothetical protein
MRTHRVLAALAVVAGPAALAALASPVDAGASQTTGGASGVVKDAATGKPLSGVCVTIVEASDNTSVGQSKPSNSSGAWTLKGIAPATDYTAVTQDCGAKDYVGEWYKNQDFQPNATQFTVAAGSVTKKINFSLSKGGTVSGTVTDSVTGDPVQNVLVVALWTTADQASTFAECTSATGTYKLQDVPTSGAIVWFDTESSATACGLATPYDEAYYLNSTSYASATVVPVKAQKVTKNINQVLTASSEG